MLMSDRGIPLIFQDSANVPVITLENYLKWYSIYVVKPGGMVQKVPVQVLNQIESDIPEKHLSGNHVFHPYLLEKIAEHYNGYVDEISLEVSCGRWIFEFKNTDAKNI